MSVPIHHIYSYVTLLFSVVPSTAILPSENTQIRTKFIAPIRRASFFPGRTRVFQFTSQADHSVVEMEIKEMVCMFRKWKHIFWVIA